MADENAVALAYLDEVRRNFRGYKRLAEGTFAQLQDADFFRSPDPESLCVALLVKHIAGNQRSRWTDFLTTDGEKPDRHRDEEFERRPDDTRASLMARWEDGWRLLFAALEPLGEADLARI